MKQENDRPSALDRARGGEWDAFEDLLGQAVAPTFDAAVHLLGPGPESAAAAEEALYGLLLGVRRGEIKGGDPLRYTARALVRSAEGAARSAFSEGLDADDLVQVGLPPDDGRGKLFAKVAPLDRNAAALDVALDLAPHDLAFALERPEAEALAALNRAFKAVPSDRPRDALRDLMDGRAAKVRLSVGLEDRVLDRLESAW